MRRVSFRCGLCALALAIAASCARPPLANPNVTSGLGVVMGRMQIFREGEDVTKDCTVGLTEDRRRLIFVRLDAAGWVFASMPQGEAEIASVDCGESNPVVGLSFDIPGDGRTTYFGHIRLDLFPETVSVISQQNASAIQQGVSNANPPTHPTPGVNVAISTGVQLAAMLLLSESVAAGMATVEVEDKTYDAIAAYHARYKTSPKGLVVALAGSSFSSDSSIPSSVQRQGDVIFTEASFGGVRLTWLGVSRPEQRNAALRVQRFVREDTPCASIKLVLDGKERVVPVASKTERASAALKQTVQGELDLYGVRDVASAKHVIVDVCGTVRELSALAKGATINFANAYQDLITKAPPPAAAAPPATPAAPPPAAAALAAEPSVTQRQ